MCNGNQVKLFRSWQRVHVNSDFPSIEDPQDEALRQRFICSVNNEAVLKALFKVKDTDLTFTRAVQVAIETEDAARVAKASQQCPPEQDEGSSAEPSAVSFQRPAKVLPMWKGPQSNGLPLQRSQVSFLWQKGTFESCLPEEEDHKSWTCESNPRLLKILLGWMCPSQSRTVSSPWNWTLPLREILCLYRSGNN